MNLVDVIANLSVFKELSESYLSRIAQNSNIKNYQPKETIFLKNEEEIYYHIIISGSVKIYSTSSEGEELIMVILKSEEFLNSIFSTHHLSNASALNETKILRIKKEFLLEEIKNNSSLVLKILKEESQQNQNLFQRIEQLNLLNAEEKVGNFLLKESIHNNTKRSSFKLQNKKSLIASYLKIKPETLSRIFDKLKKENKIEINNSDISLKKEDSLCEFCDTTLSKNCSNNTKHFCQQKNF